jgi:hypothetical protein
VAAGSRGCWGTQVAQSKKSKKVKISAVDQAGESGVGTVFAQFAGVNATYERWLTQMGGILPPATILFQG